MREAVSTGGVLIFYDTQHLSHLITFEVVQSTSTLHACESMSERNSQTPSTRQAPFGTRLKKALRLSSVPLGMFFARDGYRKL